MTISHPSDTEPVFALPPLSDRLVRRFPEYPHSWSFEPSERWVRGFVGETAVVDSKRPILVWEPRHKVPEYGFFRADVKTELLSPTDPPPADRGFYRPRLPVAQWFDLTLGERVIRHAAWKWQLPELDDYLGVNWFHGVLDYWLEEDEPVITHPRDPFNRVDALPSSRHVVVSYRGRVLADSRATIAVFETGLPTRYYFPAADVDFSALDGSTTWSECPYKGYASEYWGVAGAVGVRDIAWSYPDPKPAVAAIAHRVAFYTERLDIAIDGITTLAADR